MRLEECISPAFHGALGSIAVVRRAISRVFIGSYSEDAARTPLEDGAIWVDVVL